MEDYSKRAKRMLARWSGHRQPVRDRKPESNATQRRESCFSHSQQTDSGSILEPERQIPILTTCDVLVVGAGPAGISAALAASRAGADTVLIERFGCFGGVITTVGMETLAWYRYEGTVDCEGIGVELERRAADMGASIKWPYNDSQCLDADFFKIVADKLISESKVRPLLHCFAVDALVRDNIVQGVITESKSGRQAVCAKTIVDATGDADIAHRAGATYKELPPAERMGVTTVFSCAGVDKEKFLSYTEAKGATYADWGQSWDQKTTGKEDNLRTPYLQSEFEEAKAKGFIPNNCHSLGGSWSAISDAGEATNLNLVHLQGYDALDVWDLTAAEMEGRRQTLHALSALRHCVPGFEKAKLRNLATTLGIRDTRKIIGQYNLSQVDVMEEGRFEDSIGIFPEFIDGYNILILPTTGRYFEVPFGCIVPQGVDNLLVAGRCVAGDKTSHAAMRNMMACTVTGQGAGVAAAVAARRNEKTSSVSISAVQRELLSQGVRIH